MGRNPTPQVVLAAAVLNQLLLSDRCCLHMQCQLHLLSICCQHPAVVATTIAPCHIPNGM